MFEILAGFWFSLDLAMLHWLVASWQADDWHHALERFKFARGRQTPTNATPPRLR
jgi:hypothetical protein